MPRNLTLADIGCGTGSLTFELARFAEKVIGVDLSQEMLRRARAGATERTLENVEFRQGDVLKLPLDAHSVDAAFCVMVLHFLADPERAVSGLCRIVRPGGSVILVDLVEHSKNGCASRWRTGGWVSTAPLIEKCVSQRGRRNQSDYDLTGSFAGEKIARNGNQPVEIFVARANLPARRTLRKKQPKR